MWKIASQGAIKKLNEWGGDGSSPEKAIQLMPRGDEAVPAPLLNTPYQQAKPGDISFC